MKKNILLLFLFLISITTFAQSEYYEDDSDTLRNLRVFESKEKFCLSISKKIDFNNKFDTIEIDDNYAFCKSKKVYKIISQKTGKTIIVNVRAFFKVGNSTKYYQLLKNNEIIWLDLNSNISKLKPNTSLLITVCGTVESYRNRIIQNSDKSITTLEFKETDNYLKKRNDTTYDLTSQIGKKILVFLNNSATLEYDANSNFSKNLNNSIFFEKLQDGRYNIIKLEFKSNVIKTVLVENIENKYDLSNKNNNFNPFIFNKQNLFGYYPINLDAKYIYLNPLNMNFAKFMLPNGKSGWLDINGNEYLDK